MPSRRSLWAIASVLCSAAACPPLCLIGPLLGMVALEQIRRRPHYTGRPLAITGIVLGLLLTIGWLWAGRWWHVNVRTPMLDGPRAAITAGMAGDVDAFISAFQTQASPDLKAEAVAFLAELDQRYGDLLAMRQEGADLPTLAPQDIDRTRLTIPYAMRFERAAVPAEARFIIGGESGWPMILKWQWIIIHDAGSGDLAYPASALSEPTGSPDQTGSPDHDDAGN